jgi:hypothetical protein
MKTRNLIFITALLAVPVAWAQSGLQGGIKYQPGAYANTNAIARVTIDQETNVLAGAYKATNLSASLPIIADANKFLQTTSAAGFRGLISAPSSGTTISAGTGMSGGGDLSANRTVNWDPTTQVASFTFFDGSQSSRTITFNLSGTDPVLTVGSGTFTFTGSGIFSGAVTPSANDGAALGSASVSWADLFLASGGVINFNNGNYTITHSSGVLTFSGAIASSEYRGSGSGLMTIANGADGINATNNGTAGVFTFGMPVTLLSNLTATLDASVAGLTIKFTDYKDFIYPSRVDGAGCTITTNDYTSNLWGLAAYSGSADTNGNYAVFRVGTVPLDLDTSVAMVLKGLTIRVAGTDTDAAEFTIALYSPSSSGAGMPSDFTACSTFINFDSGTLTSPASGDVFFVSDVTLTGWAGALTAGRPLIVAIARRNGSNDDSVAITAGTIEYTRTK